MQIMDADVIIAGAGPAGAIAACVLASSGVSVLVIEKALFPRYKVCGGGLTHKIISEIPLDLGPVIEAPVFSIRFSCGFKEIFTRNSATPMMYCTMRDRLDKFILDEAVQKGAVVRFEEQVTGVTQDAAGVKVETSKGTYHARLLIGAEGASGTVSRAIGLRDHIMQGLAWEAELKPPPGFLEKFGSTVFLDWGTFPGGYGWIFPKKDHISVGVGGPATLSKGMMPYYERFLASAGITTDISKAGELAFSETLSLKSWPIPVRVKKTQFHKGNIMIAGDAAGLTDPLTGEGIYYAVRSGKLAAKACIDHLSGDSGAMAAYTRSVNDELMNELTEANRIKAIFNMMPGTIHNWVKTSDRAWGAFGKILRGERFYADVRSGFGTLRFFWGLSCWFAGIVSRIKENRYVKRNY